MMNRLGWAGLVALAVPCALLPIACGDDSKSGGGSIDPPIDGSTADVEFIVRPTTDAEANLAVVDVANTPCTPHGGTETTLYSPASPLPGLVTTGRVGARRMAATIYEGFVLFDADGANPSASLVAPFEGATRTATVGSRVFTVWKDAGKYFTKLYDEQGGSPTAQSEVTSEPAEDVAIGGGGDVGLVMWGSTQSVRARGISVTGEPAGPAFDLIAPGVASLDWSGAVAHGGGTTFGVAWAGGTAGDYRVYFNTTSNVARNGLPRRLVTSAKPTSVIAVARLKSGYAILARYDDQPHLLLVDDAGKPVPPVRRLLGTNKAIGLAAIGDEVAVLAAREEIEAPDEDGGVPVARAGAFEIRPFGFPAGDPLGGWVCLGAKPIGDVKAAIDADGSGKGYAIVQRTSTGSLSLVRTDRLGTAAP